MDILTKERDGTLALAARQEKVAPIVYHTTYQKSGSILLRQTPEKARPESGTSGRPPHQNGP